MTTKTRAQLDKEFNDLLNQGEHIVSPHTKHSEVYNKLEDTTFPISPQDVYDITHSSHIVGDSMAAELGSLVENVPLAIIPQKLLNGANYEGGLSVSEVLGVVKAKGVVLDSENKKFVLGDKNYSPIGLVDLLHSEFEGRISPLPPTNLAEYIDPIATATLEKLTQLSPEDSISSSGALYHELAKVGVKVDSTGNWHAHRELSVIHNNQKEATVYSPTETHLARQLSVDQVSDLALALVTKQDDGSSRLVSLGEIFYSPIAPEMVHEEPEVTGPSLASLEYEVMADRLSEDVDHIRLGRFTHVDLDGTTLEQYCSKKGSISVNEGGQWMRNKRVISAEKAASKLLNELEKPYHTEPRMFDPNTLSRKAVLLFPYTIPKAVIGLGIGASKAAWNNKSAIAGVAALAGAVYLTADLIAERNARTAYIANLEANQRPDYGAKLLNAKTSEEAKSIIDTYVVNEGQDVTGTSRATQGFSHCISNPLGTPEGLLVDMTEYGTKVIGDENEAQVGAVMIPVAYDNQAFAGESYWGGNQLCAKKQ